jgi:lipid-binding SYLF domain-containing protein
LRVAECVIAKKDKIMEQPITVKKTLMLNGFLIAALMAIIVSFAGFSQIVHAKTAKEIDASADAALDRFYKQVEGAREVARKAKGLLILPDVKKAGLIVGGEYGQGALRIHGKTVDYYRIVSGSIGIQIGAQAKDIVIAFMTDDALKSFRTSKGWEAGLDGNVALITVGGGASVTTMNTNHPILGFVYDVKGFIGDFSLKGAKFSKIDVAQ